MHILLLTSEFPPYLIGGLGTHVSQLAAGLLRADIRVTVGLILHNYVITIDLRQDSWHSTTVVQTEGDFYDRQIAANGVLFDQLKPHIQSFGIDLIHSHDWLSFSAGQLLAAHAGIPHITTVHMLQKLLERLHPTINSKIFLLEKDMLRQSHQLIAVSNAMRRMIGEIEPACAAKTKVIYNWVDRDAFHPHNRSAKDVQQEFAPQGEQLVLFVGRLTLQKGLGFLIDSAEIVRRQLPNTRWIIVGRINAEARHHYGALISSAATGHICFVGERSRAELTAFFAAASCVVVPSVFEPFGLVAIEAMRAGAPVIVSDVDGLQEIVDHERDGLRVPVDTGRQPAGPDLALLAQAQIRLLQDQALRQRLAQAAQAKVEALFQDTRCIAQIIDLYKHTTEQYTGADQARPPA
ncbi:MAG: glycosyltransferase family 4 protein [Roseiflexaceae bacterium]